MVIAEIISGMAIGKSGMNLVRTDPTLEFLSLLGFTYLMFLSGLEIDFSQLKHIKSSPLIINPFKIGLKIFLVTISLSFFFAKILQQINVTNNPLFLTLIFATTSLGIVIPSLRAKVSSKNQLGK